MIVYLGVCYPNMYSQGYLGISEFQMTEQGINTFALEKFTNMNLQMTQAKKDYLTDIHPSEQSSVTIFVKQMSREIEKAAFLVVDNMQSVYSRIFTLTKEKQ